MVPTPRRLYNGAMTPKDGTAATGAEDKAGWVELFRDGRGAHTTLGNLGIGLHALDIFQREEVLRVDREVYEQAVYLAANDSRRCR